MLYSLYIPVGTIAITLLFEEDQSFRKHIYVCSDLGEGDTSKADPEYAKRIFDDMAPVFEKRLVQDLGYNCPWGVLLADRRCMEEAS